MDKHIKIALIISATAIICVWLMRAHNRYRLEPRGSGGLTLLDTVSGRVWRGSGDTLTEMEKQQPFDPDKFIREQRRKNKASEQ